VKTGNKRITWKFSKFVSYARDGKTFRRLVPDLHKKFLKEVVPAVLVARVSLAGLNEIYAAAAAQNFQLLACKKESVVVVWAACTVGHPHFVLKRASYIGSVSILRKQ
jgi:hypothetical protein